MTRSEVDANDVSNADHAAAAAAAGHPAPPPSPAPPRGPRLWILLVIVGTFAAALALGAVAHAPLHKGWTDLTQAVAGKKVAAAAPTAAHQYYTCSMHPFLLIDHPGDCPICGMTLVPVNLSNYSGEVAIDPVVAQDIGVRISPVVGGPIVQRLRTVGTVAYDETKVRDINTKISGWIEKLHVDYLGQHVTAGEPLFELYSPELYAAQEEYLLAWKNQGKVGASFVPDAAQGASDLLAAARTKLEYFDITPQQIAALQKRGTPAKTMTIRSPYDGVVTAKQALEGMKLTPGTPLYKIADLSKVWVMVTLYEYQLPFVELGQAATMRLSYLPGREFRGKVIYIYPYIDNKARQITVRLAFDNADGLLKPGMYATIDLDRTLSGAHVLAPRSAVIDTGERKVALVSLGRGRFEPRDVQTGVDARDGMVEILSGLKPGEQVVTSGQFLLDSEANRRESLAKMITGKLAAAQKPAVDQLQNAATAALSDAAQQEVDAITSAYLALHDELSADRAKDAADLLGHIHGAAVQLAAADDAQLKAAAGQLAKASTAQPANLDDARAACQAVSPAVVALVKLAPPSSSVAAALYQFHCPTKQTDWIQASDQIANPFYGSDMSTCGNMVGQLSMRR